MAALFVGKEEFKIRQNKTLLEGKWYKNTTLSYNEKIGGILQHIGGNSEDLHWGASSQDIQEVVRMVVFVIFSM